MSYQVLARKWRPRTFHELVGQTHVQRALVNALDQGRLHHAYLFTGTRGVGKTTLARILAKCLNCTAGGEGDEGVTSTPCGQCDSCRAIDEGRFVDLIEVDAASRTKVEDTRELLDNVQYAPTQGRYKVYLIDEVHMLSTSSFNALLKTLEEPPPHVKFLLATTDPHRLPPTVLSRCLQFTLKHLPPERVVEHLTQVLSEEGVAFEKSALWLLGKAAEGSMRDAMSLTDQAIAFGQGVVHHADVAAMLGTLDHRHVLALIEALAEVDVARLLDEVARLAEQGPDFAAVLDDVTTILHRLAVAQMVPDAVDNGHGDRETVLALAGRFTAEDVQLYYQIGIQGRGDMAHAPDLRSALEMTLMRMLAFRPQGVPRPPATPLPLQPERPATDAASDAQVASAPPPETAPPEASPQASPPWGADPVSPAETPSAPPDPKPEPAPEPAPDAAPEPDSDPASEPMVETASAPVEPEPAAADSAPAAPERLDHAGWLDGFAALGLGGLTRSLAANCQLKHDDGATLELRLDPEQAAMQAEIHETRIARALAAQGLERRVTFTSEPLDPTLETPRQRDGRLAQARHARALDTLNRDPHVQQLKETFGATFMDNGVTPTRNTD
ncbi:DNA polymerase III subunit gamma/tau [Halomonas piscis]|uniref:DNA polymerase III subunit gamma/tau n=1 Tax=Halomonas piscis TaxID=3031727 RepID=A0ABY9YWJ2_9GAMM|nr:DNA polymerase III subunit gamma/tau [Halomonas piscis]WNK19233.1 DNA polymerase III subunit gamma/tau [Halomonas piscis]